MRLYFPLDVDLYNPSPMPVMEAQQNNIGRGALVTLKANGAFVSLEGESVQLYAKKPDGTISYLPCTIIGSQIQCDFTNQMLALPGMVQVELQMIGGTSGNETEITTPIFCVKVNPSNVDDSVIESQDEFPALVTALAELADLKEHGLKGDPGEAATIQVGTVTASDPGSNPQVTNSGTEQDAVFNFVLPRGEKGPTGPAGPTQVYFGARSSFPETGQENMLYVDNTVNPALAYIWNGSAYIPAGGGGEIAAADVTYSNTSSGLTAQTVQAAIDENAEAISGLNSRFGFVIQGHEFELATASSPVVNGQDYSRTFTIGKEGYSPLGIVGYDITGDYNTRFSLNRNYINTFTGQYYIAFRTDVSSVRSTNLKIAVYILYLPD